MRGIARARQCWGGGEGPGGRSVRGGAPGLAAGEEAQAQLALREDGQAAQVADATQALWQRHRPAEPREQLLQQRRTAALHLAHEALHGGDAGRGDGELRNRSDEVEGFVVIAAAHARLDELRRLEQLEERAVLREQAATALVLRLQCACTAMSFLALCAQAGAGSASGAGGHGCRMLLALRGQRRGGEGGGPGRCGRWKHRRRSGSAALAASQRGAAAAPAPARPAR